jgi:cold shock CspA family protein/cytidylate kinase
MDNIIAIYGQTCCLKTEAAREISRFTGFKLTDRGELATTRAKVARALTAAALPEEVHRAIDDETREIAKRDEPLMIFESAFMDAVLQDVKNVFFVRLKASDEVRGKRWAHRKEEGGGRTRQLGESIEQRDSEDAALRKKLYGSETSGVTPALDIDTSNRKGADVALEIWETFQKGSQMVVVTNKPPMDKTAKKGVSPGPAKGIVKSYNPKRMPFGGFITDEKSGTDIFVHKSALVEFGVSELQKGQRVEFQIVEDGFGSFKATKIRAADA